MIKNLKNINKEKIKKSVKKGALVLAIGTSIGTTTGCNGIVETAVFSIIGTIGVQTEIENARRNSAYNIACGVIDAAKYEYVSSLLDDQLITSGNVTDLKTFGQKATSGTWSAMDIDNDGDLEILLKDVEIGNYIINSSGTPDSYDLDVKRKQLIK